MTAVQPWGTGRYLDGDGSAKLISLSSTEFDREVAVAQRRLSAWGVESDDVLLVVASVAEAVQFAPFQRAARALGGISCTAEPSPYDARRTSAFLDQYRLRAVIGLDNSVLDGLSEFGDLDVLLRRCDNLIVRSDALARVAALGLKPASLTLLGPTVAVECPARAGGHVGGDNWNVGSDDEGLWVEPRVGRDIDVGRVRPGIDGHVERDRCACGSDDPRVVTA